MSKEILNPNDFAPNDPKAPNCPGDSGKPNGEPLTPCPPSSWERDWVEGEIVYLGRPKKDLLRFTLKNMLEDLRVSREMVASIQGDTPLKTLHQERIDYLNNLLGLTDGL